MRKIILLMLVVMSGMADDRGEFYAGGDWLYWKAEQQNMQYGSAAVITTETPLQISSKILKPDFKMHNGYRVFAGYTTEDQFWDISLSYSHLSTSANSVYTGDPSDSARFFVFLADNFPLLNGAVNVPFTNAGQHWRGDINYIDLDLAKSFMLCDDLEINPHVGIRGQWMNQKNRIFGANPVTFAIRSKTELNGIGLEGGLGASWNLPYGLSLIGHLGGALTYCKVVSKSRLLVSVGATNEDHNPSYVSNIWIDSFIGLSYNKSYCNYLFNVHAGWEHHLIYNANQFSLNGGGDLSLQGLTLGASVEF